MKRLFVFLIIVLEAIMSVCSQNQDYYLKQAESYQREAEYYFKQAEGYERDAQYYITLAQKYLKDAEYYAKKNDLSRVSTYQRWAMDASDKAQLRSRWAEDAKGKGLMRLKWAKEALKRANNGS